MLKKILIVVIIIIAIIAGLYSCGKRKIYNTIIDTVKNGYFEGVQENVTIGEMMDTLCTHSKWEYTPNTESGLVYVTYTGTMQGQPIVMQFFVTNFAGEMMFRLDSFSLNGEITSRADDILRTANQSAEIDMIPYALYKAYRTVKGR